MDTLSVLRSQYGAALSMLDAVVARCPDESWTLESRLRPFWRVAFHTMFFTHLYVHHNEAEFKRWEKHRDESQHLGLFKGPPDGHPNIGEP